MKELARRAFLANALVVTFALSRGALAQDQGKKLPQSLAKTPELDAWIRVGADGTITVGGISEKVGYEVSTGIGAHANVDADFTWDKVQLGWDAGVTFGVGGGLSQEITFSPKDVVNSVGDLFGF